jgi:peptidoglycan/LPS O-acetylase OafA/YrhL
LFRNETEDALSQISPKHEQDRVPVLDLLRLLAALAVVLFHYAFRGAAADGFTNISLPLLEPVAKYGSFGVELFFVISGFVIARSALGRTAIDFGIARAARLWPAFAVCTTVTFIVTYFFGAPRFGTSFVHWAANLTMLSPAFGQPFMDGAYWSIVREIVFYGWMALFVAFSLFPRRVDEIVLGWLSIALVNEALLHSKILLYLFATDYAGFFCAGILLAEIARGRRGWQAPFLIAVSAVVACSEALSDGRWTAGHYSTYIDPKVMIGLTIVAIALVAAASRIKHVPLSGKVLMALGGLTYPLYLLHQHVGYIAFNRLGRHIPAEILVPATAIVMIGAALVVSRYVEPRGRKLVIAVSYAVVGSITPTVSQLASRLKGYAAEWAAGAPLRTK